VDQNVVRDRVKARWPEDAGVSAPSRMRSLVMGLSSSTRAVVSAPSYRGGAAPLEMVGSCRRSVGQNGTGVPLKS
jgi:hypothetical protein